MTIKEAEQICRELEGKQKLSPDEEFRYLDTMQYLVEEKKEPRDMMHLGGYYYEQRKFDLALKYYEMAAAYEDCEAYVCLGYIWYYGRCGERDFEKAFFYYSKAKEKGDVVAAYKVADMYKNGYHVEKDMVKYKQIIEELAGKIKNARYLGEPLPEIYTRLAAIRAEEGEWEEAIRLYLAAKSFLSQRISYNAFFGNLSIMKGLIQDLYRLMEFDPEDMDLYDLYYLCQWPCRVRFRLRKQTCEVESVMEDGACVLKFGDHWYRTIDDFFAKAQIGKVPVTALAGRLTMFEVMEWKR